MHHLDLDPYHFAVLSLGTRDQIEIAPVLGILVGIVTALLLITVIILGALKVRQSRRDGRALRPRFLAVKDKVTLPLRSESEDLFEKDDKNPDVVPSNKGRFTVTHCSFLHYLKNVCNCLTLVLKVLK